MSVQGPAVSWVHDRRERAAGRRTLERTAEDDLLDGRGACSGGESQQADGEHRSEYGGERESERAKAAGGRALPPHNARASVLAGSGARSKVRSSPRPHSRHISIALQLRALYVYDSMLYAVSSRPSSSSSVLIRSVTDSGLALTTSTLRDERRGVSACASDWNTVEHPPDRLESRTVQETGRERAGRTSSSRPS